MTATESIRRFLNEIREIDRKQTMLNRAKSEKVRALRKLQTEEAMSSSVVQSAPQQLFR